ncbi:MAG: NifU family protein [Anaerolineales bacterium]|nr:NifU family protein [Anaerolineales bacterium]
MTTTTPTLAEENLDSLADRVDMAMMEVQKLDSADKAKALDLKRAIEEFHKVGITRIVQRLKSDPRGKELLFELVDVPEVYALFAMHGIVRADIQTQASRVLEMVRPFMRSHGGDVELVKVEGETAFVKLHGACNGCSMSAVTLRNGVEEALKEHLPQIKQVEVVPTEPEAGMILLDTVSINGKGGGLEDDKQLTIGGWVKGPPVDEVEEGRPFCLNTANGSVLLIRLENKFFAYKNECSHMAMPLDGGMLDTESCILTCPWHGFRYDVTTGECMTAPQAQLEPFPLRVQGGSVWVRPGG